jgi:hypothetical protein
MHNILAVVQCTALHCTALHCDTLDRERLPAAGLGMPVTQIRVFSRPPATGWLSMASLADAQSEGDNFRGVAKVWLPASQQVDYCFNIART